MKKYLVAFLSIFLLFPYLSFSRVAADSKSGKAPVALARAWNKKTDVSGWWMSEKLDGVRGYWTGKEMISRSGKPFSVPEWFTANFPPFPLDGELWMGRKRFSELSGVVRRKKPDKRWKNVGYFIFDAPRPGVVFEKRLDLARDWFKKHPSVVVKIIKQEICESADHLLKKLAEVESKGGEGLMLRRAGSRHTVGRSSDLLKIKSFKDAEAKVIKHLPGKGKHAGRLGALLVELPNGVRFSIGTGFSDKERENPPPPGSVVTFKFHSLAKSGVPRFASFLRVRKKI